MGDWRRKRAAEPGLLVSRVLLAKGPVDRPSYAVPLLLRHRFVRLRHQPVASRGLVRVHDEERGMETLQLALRQLDRAHHLKLEHLLARDRRVRAAPLYEPQRRHASTTAIYLDDVVDVVADEAVG